jgi:hypothetical protein
MPQLRGTLSLRTASAERYSLNLVGGLNALAAQLNERPIHSFAYGGLRQVPLYVPVESDTSSDVFNVPGLVFHANQTITDPHGHDYIFAPLSNAAAYDPAHTWAPATVNPWVVLATAAEGLPAGGSFHYTTPTAPVPPAQPPAGGGPLPPAPRPEAPMCPFPWLSYVLRSIFEELGLHVAVETFLPGELSRAGSAEHGRTARRQQLSAGRRAAGFDRGPTAPAAARHLRAGAGA